MTYVSSLYEIFPKEPTVQETLHDNVSNWKVAPQIYYVTLYVCMNGQLALDHSHCWDLKLSSSSVTLCKTEGYFCQTSAIYFCLGFSCCPYYVIVGCLELTVVSYTSTYLMAVNAQLVPSPNKHPLQISFVYLPLALKRSLSLLFTAIGYWLTPTFSVTIALLTHHTLE